MSLLSLIHIFVRGSGVADKAVAVAVNGGRVLALSVLGCGWAGAVGIAGAVLLHPLLSLIHI